jgi:hypothetical protein
MGTRPGQHTAHGKAALAQATDQVETFVGSDATGDNQQNTLSGKWHWRISVNYDDEVWLR